jgi:hypothetical protein
MPPDSRTPAQRFVDELLWRWNRGRGRLELDHLVATHTRETRDNAIRDCIRLAPEAASRLEALLSEPVKRSRTDVLRAEMDRKVT